jgi:hypothetical protein
MRRHLQPVALSCFWSLADWILISYVKKHIRPQVMCQAQHDRFRLEAQRIDAWRQTMKEGGGGGEECGGGIIFKLRRANIYWCHVLSRPLFVFNIDSKNGRLIIGFLPKNIRKLPSINFLTPMRVHSIFHYVTNLLVLQWRIYIEVSFRTMVFILG